MAIDIYAPPQTIKTSDDCLFYHTLDIPGTGVISGRWDLRGRLSDYIGEVDVKRKRVLDVGAASGFLSFEMEKLGAEVVSFEAGSAKDMDRLPFAQSLYSINRLEWEKQVNESIDSLKRSYWFAHERIGSKVKVLYGSIYDLPEGIGQFDVVTIGQILVHLSDPVSALGSVARKCSDTIVITEGMVESNSPIMALCADPDNGPDWSWWHLSIGLYQSVLKMMGFSIVRISDAVYDSQRLGPTKLHTIVAKRDSESNQGSNLGAW
jgi:2-polyprenyl-3-methyl-5-hydroxy-6-metoxy-1,4-benzoquinol methylase